MSVVTFDLEGLPFQGMVNELICQMQGTRCRHKEEAVASRVFISTSWSKTTISFKRSSDIDFRYNLTFHLSASRVLQ